MIRRVGLASRGTSRSPGADPTRLPIGLDLRAISIVEGIRAGLAAALPMAASVWFAQPLLTLAALGALLTCICDPGGPIRRRLPVLLAFILLGGSLLGGFGLIRQFGIAPTVLLAAPALFCLSFLRVWGQATQALGNLLSVVLLLGTDAAVTWHLAAMQAAIFIGGGLWALLLTLAIWQIHPYGPARRAVADVWAALASGTRTVQDLITEDAATEAWDAYARGGRGAIRAAMETARTTLMETLDARGPSSGPAAQNLMRLEAADQLFVVLIALADSLEQAPADTRQAALPLLRRLRALLVILTQATERETLTRSPRVERSIAALVCAAEPVPALRPFAQAIADRLRVATKLVDPAQYLPGSGQQGEAGISLRRRLTDPLSANLSWKSAGLRHATRIAAVVVPALAATLVWHGRYTHWLTITLVLVMQPFFALTWQRSLERVAGTLLGGAVAAMLSAVTRSGLHIAGLLPVLGALALAVRQVSYGVYIAVYTPTVILLVESTRPHESQWRIAAWRAGYTVLGGLIAVAANLLLWPTWEPDQVERDLLAAIAAHADLARAVLQSPPGARPGESDRLRRLAGLASNNLEASLARAMQEPRRGQRDRLQAVLVADSTLRRIAGRLIAMTLELRAATPRIATPGDRAATAWLTAALDAMAAARAPPPRADAERGTETLDRLARQVALLAGTIGRTIAPRPAPLPTVAPATAA